MAGLECLPIEVVEPRVLFKIFDASWTRSKSILGFSLQALIDEVCCLDRPAFRNLVAFDLDLSTENLFTDLFSCPSSIRSAALHALVGDDPDCEIIRS